MITVVTITFNNYEELLQTLASIDGLAIESVVINGGSCEKTKKFLDNYSGTSVSEPDLGVSDAFNKGISKSTGESIMFLNSGDLLTDPNYLKDADVILRENSTVDFVYADVLLIDTIAGPIIIKSNGVLPNIPYLHPTLILRKKCFTQTGNFKLKYKSLMDLELTYRMAKAGLKGLYLERPVVKMDGTGISSMNYGLFLKEKVQVIIEHKDFSFSSVLIVCRLLLTFVIRKVLLTFGLHKVVGSFRRWKTK